MWFKPIEVKIQSNVFGSKKKIKDMWSPLPLKQTGQSNFFFVILANSVLFGLRQL